MLIERPHFYVQKFPNAGLIAGNSELNVTLVTDTDAPFRAFGVAFYMFDSTGAALGAAGNILAKLRFTRPDQSWFQRNLVSCQALNPFDTQAANGAGGLQAPYYGYFSPLSPNLLYPPGSMFTFDFSDLAGQTTARAYAVLIGSKLFKPGAVWSPQYPKKFTSLPFEGYAIQFSLASLPVNNIPLNILPDADFAWRSGAQTDNPSSALSPVGAVRGLGVRFKDAAGKYYMNDYVPIELIFGFDNAQRPGLFYPEIYIPKNQQLYFDVQAL